MGETFLIDTNILIEYSIGILPVSVTNTINNIIDNKGFNISVITQIEILGHPLATNSLADFLKNATIYQLTQEIVIQTIELRKVKKIKLPDAIIAATAKIYNHDLMTRNIRDFKNIINLTVVDPYSF